MAPPGQPGDVCSLFSCRPINAQGMEEDLSLQGCDNGDAVSSQAVSGSQEGGANTSPVPTSIVAGAKLSPSPPKSVRQGGAASQQQLQPPASTLPPATSPAAAKKEPPATTKEPPAKQPAKAAAKELKKQAKRKRARSSSEDDEEEGSSDSSSSSCSSSSSEASSSSGSSSASSSDDSDAEAPAEVAPAAPPAAVVAAAVAVEAEEAKPPPQRPSSQPQALSVAASKPAVPSLASAAVDLCVTDLSVKAPAHSVATTGEVRDVSSAECVFSAGEVNFFVFFVFSAEFGAAQVVNAFTTLSRLVGAHCLDHWPWADAETAGGSARCVQFAIFSRSKVFKTACAPSRWTRRSFQRGTTAPLPPPPLLSLNGARRRRGALLQRSFAAPPTAGDVPAAEGVLGALPGGHRRRPAGGGELAESLPARVGPSRRWQFVCAHRPRVRVERALPELGGEATPRGGERRRRQQLQCEQRRQQRRYQRRQWARRRTERPASKRRLCGTAAAAGGHGECRRRPAGGPPTTPKRAFSRLAAAAAPSTDLDADLLPSTRRPHLRGPSAERQLSSWHAGVAAKAPTGPGLASAGRHGRPTGAAAAAAPTAAHDERCGGCGAVGRRPARWGRSRGSRRAAARRRSTAGGFRWRPAGPWAASRPPGDAAW